MSLEAEFGLEATLGDIGRTLRGLRDRQRPPQQPVFYRVVRHKDAPANGLALAHLGGPDQGHFWYVRSVTIGGLTAGTAALGVADLYVSAAELSDVLGTEPGLADWRDRATRLPSIGFYGAGELELRLNEKLFVRFSGLTAGQSYVVAAQIEDYQEAPTPQSWER